MAKRAQAVPHFLIDRFLYLDLVLVGVWEESGCVLRLLDIHAIVKQPGEELHMAERLILAAHDAEGHDCPAILCRHRWNDGVKRALARRDAVRMSRLHNETLATVLQVHTAFRRQDSRTEIVKHRIDETAGIAVLVDHGDVHGAFMCRQRTFRKVCQGAVRIDLRTNGVGMLCREHGVHRNIAKRRIADIEPAVAIGKFASLDFMVHAFQ